MKAKQQTRKDVEQLFSEQNSEKLREKDILIQKNVLEYIDKNNFKNICIYESFNDEVDTSRIITELQEKQIKIYTPQVIGETEMILIDEEYEHYEKEIDIFIIPARAYTKEGERLGRGKGYYDRFLSHKLYKKSKKVGVCYDFQIFPELKTEKHDINMNLILTN